MPEETPVSEVNELISKVVKNQEAWQNLSYAIKLRMLYDMKQQLNTLYMEWGIACNKSRGITKEDYSGRHFGVGLVIGPGLFGLHLNQWIETYEALVASGEPPKPSVVRQYEDTTIAQVYPYKFGDKLFTAGVRVELHMEPGKPATQGASLKTPPSTVGILGAGNFESPNDVLTKMFGWNQTVVYKTHPNLAGSTGPFFKQLLRSVVEPGYLAIVEGAVSPATAMIQHDQVDELLMTGGAATFDRIVWGSGSPDEIAARKRAGQRQMTKKFDAELGAASPFIIVPGEWTKAEMDHCVEWLVTLKMMNSSSICASPQNILVDQDWAQREEFEQRIDETMKNYPPVPVFYAGSAERVKTLVDGTVSACENAKVSWPRGDNPKDWRDDGKRDQVRPAIIHGATPDALVMRQEAFAPIMAFVPVTGTGGDPAKFLAAAVDIANTKCFGSLSCSLVVDPRTQAKCQQALDKAVYDLQWGTVAVNEWGGSGSMYGVARWGALPGLHSDVDVQSGIGEINNCRLFDHAKKTVLWSPLMNPGHARIPSEEPARKKLGLRAVHYMLNPSFFNLGALMSAAILGL